MRKFFIFVVLIGLMMSVIPSEPQSTTQAHGNFGAEWFDNAIMYEVFVRSFRDSDGDGIGDLRGVIEGLDYIQSLGANTLWLMPIHPSPSYHGYDITDYYTINPDYGTLEDMQALINEVHARDMYIIIDYVANHSSNQHPFFEDAYGNPDSEYSDYYRWVNDEHTSYHSFAGVQHMPELNYDNGAVRQYMIKMAKFWLDPNGDGNPDDGVDGLRCDVAIGPPLSFWRELRANISQLNPEVLLLGEVWLRSAIDLDDYLQGDTFNALFDFPTFHAIVADHDSNDDGAVSGQVSFDFVRISLKGGMSIYPEGAHLIRFINNHDTNRIMSEAEGDIERAKAAAVWLFTAPGTPMMYYGEEIGMFGTKGSGGGYYDEYRREPLDWYASGRGEGMATWFRPGDRNNLSNDNISIEEQEDDPASLLNFYRALGAYRNATPALRGGFGSFEFSKEGRELYGVWRGDLSGEFVLVMMNFTQDDITASLNDATIPVTDLGALEMPFSAGFSANGLEFTLEAGGYVVLQ